jgi:hypothetical protein
MNYVWIIQQIVDKSIIGVNFVLRLLVIWMIKQMAYKTISLETQSIMRLVFII